MRDAIHVVAGILLKVDGRVLIAERIGDPAMRNLWEFPGGKVAEGESAQDALRRELREELGIEARSFDVFTRLTHEYPDRLIDLEILRVHDWSGDPRGLDGQQLAWRHPHDIDVADLLAADEPVLQQLRQMPLAVGVKKL